MAEDVKGKSMPSRFEIASWWHAAEPGWIWEIGQPYCFACGFGEWARLKGASTERLWNLARLERAHIVARSIGGGCEPSNLLLLCRRCHRDAPMLADGSVMLEWAHRRENWIVWAIGELRAELARLGVAPVEGQHFTSEGIKATALRMGIGSHPHAGLNQPNFVAWGAVMREYLRTLPVFDDSE